MAEQQLHLTNTVGWRALLNHAQYAGGVRLSAEVEEHLVALLLRYVGAEVSSADIENGLLDRFDRIANVDTRDPAVLGDQCLLFAGLIPEHVIRRGLPVAYFVQLGRSSYRDSATRGQAGLYRELDREFVCAMDTLQTLRVLDSGEPCIDGFNAFCLWHDLGSRHGWRVLRSITPSLPASVSVSDLVH